MFTITIRTAKGEPVETVSCESASCTVGRAGKNLIQLQGWHIDGVHAELVRTDNGIHVKDRSTGYGIMVNGERVTEYGPLQPGDVIALSSFQLLIDDDELSKTPDVPKQHPVQLSTPISEVAPSDTATDHAGMGAQAPAAHETDETAEHFSLYKWHRQVHKQLLQIMDLRRVDVSSMDEQQLTETIQGLIKTIIGEMSDELPAGIDKERLAKEVLNEAVGLGPLEDFLADDSVSEIMVNSFDDIYVERHGRLEKTGATFSSNGAVLSIIERIVSPLGRRIDESSPMVDARLRDGSRVNAIIPPLAIHGPCLTIRKFSRKKLTGADLVRFGSISPQMVEFLRTAVSNRKNIIVSGGTGSGKTTFLNVISGYIPHTERIVTVEDSAELQLEQPHVVSLEGRPANVEGKGEVTIRDLVRNCLRMRPDRIVVGECRGGETLDMLQAMNTGHDGSLTTVHANSPRDLISRLEVMVMMAGMELPQQAILEQISSSVDIIVQQARFVDGIRRITHITELTGLESGIVQMQNIFVFKQHGFDEQGRTLGEFAATGRIPEFYEELQGIGLKENLKIFATDHDGVD